MKYSALFALVACASTATAQQEPIPSFEQLHRELQGLAVNSNVKFAVEIAAPMMHQLGLESGLDTEFDFSPAGVLNIITAVDNSVAAFHDMVDNAGGREVFQNGGNALASAYVGGFLGHLNVANVESDKMAKITTMAQTLFSDSVEVFYVDLYNLIYSDISNKLINDVKAVTGPAIKIISDIKDIAVVLKDLFGGHKRALFEQVESLGNEIVRVLEADDISKDNLICRLGPVIEKVSKLLIVLTSEQIQKDMGDLAKLLSDFPPSNKVIVALQKSSEAIYECLKTYGPVAHDVMVPLSNTVERYIQKTCVPQRGLRALSAGALDKINPMDIITKALDFIEKLLEQAEKILNNLPETLIKDELQVLYDIIELVAPEKASYIKQITDDVSDIAHEMSQLVPALNSTKNDVQVFMADSLKTMADMKALVFDVIRLITTIIAHKHN